MTRWIHAIKGVIVGELVGDDGVWWKIRLSGGQDLRSARPGSVLPYADGDVITVRGSRMTELDQ